MDRPERGQIVLEHKLFNNENDPLPISYERALPG
jgi:hypothetical protein